MAKILYASGISRIGPVWERLLASAMDSIGIPALTLSSTVRQPDSQALAMYTNSVNRGVDNELKLYAPPGQKIINIFASMQAQKANKNDTLAAMTKGIQLVGPRNISHHLDTDTVNQATFDVPPGQIPDNKRADFEHAIKSIASKFIMPSAGEPVYHIELGKGLTVEAISTIKTVGLSGMALLAVAVGIYFLYNHYTGKGIVWTGQTEAQISTEMKS